MKSNIKDAVNTYFGNCCTRCCFNHQDIMDECYDKFSILKKKLANSNIGRKEFNQMMKNGTIKICKLPIHKRKYISWKYINNENILRLNASVLFILGILCPHLEKRFLWGTIF